MGSVYIKCLRYKYKTEIRLERHCGFQPKKKIPHTVMQPYASPKSDLDEVVKQLEEPKPELKQLTDKDGLDRSYEARTIYQS